MKCPKCGATDSSTDGSEKLCVTCQCLHMTWQQSYIDSLEAELTRLRGILESVGIVWEEAIPIEGTEIEEAKEITQLQSQLTIYLDALKAIRDRCQSLGIDTEYAKGYIASTKDCSKLASDAIEAGKRKK